MAATDIATATGLSVADHRRQRAARGDRQRDLNDDRVVRFPALDHRHWLVFAKLYFPASDPLIGTTQACAVFLVGFIARSVGAFIFGHYGDRIGRKAALIATLLLTGVATFAVSLVPSYEQIGV